MSLLSQIYSIYQPIWRLRGENRYPTLMMLGIIVVNICEAFIIAMVNNSFNYFFGVLSIPGLTYSLFFRALAQFLSAIIVLGFNLKYPLI